MVWLAVTRGGTGDVWQFDSRAEAYNHPIVQYGDVLLGEPGDLVHHYNRLSWNDARTVAGLGVSSVGVAAMSRREFAALQELQADQLYVSMQARARVPPTDPRIVCEIVSRDRRIGASMAKKKADAPDAPAAVKDVAPKAAREDGPGGSNLPPVVRGPKGTPLDAQIHLMLDTKGVQYGPDNNPKKPGSKTHGRFAMYTHGMTVQQALDAGIQTGDLSYDRDHGFVQFHGGTAAVAPAPKAAAAPAAPKAAPVVHHEKPPEDEPDEELSDEEEVDEEEVG